MVFSYQKKKKKSYAGITMPMFVNDTKYSQISLIFFLSCSLVPVTISHGDTLGSYLYHVCGGADKFTSSRDFQYQVNLNSLLLKQFIDNDITSLFYYTPHGVYPKVYGLYSCRLNISIPDCKACVYQASQEIFMQRCKNGENAMIWTEDCFVRYANTSFFGNMVTQPEHVVWYQKNVSLPEGSYLELVSFFQNLVNKVANDTSGSNYATTKVLFKERFKVWGYVQCTQDISISDCKSCLQHGIKVMFSSNTAKEGGRYLCPSCILVYKLCTPTIDSGSNGGKALEGSNGGKALEGSKEVAKISVGPLQISIVVSISVTLLLGLTALCLLYLRKKWIKRDTTVTRSVGNESSLGEAQQHSLELPLMSFNFISVATKHFSHGNKLGEGGFGPVYKGTLPNGEEIAVKRHVRTSGQGIQEYENEVSLIANLQHRNLVKLLGCCLEGNELLLIYEYMPNKSLDTFLTGPAGKKKLDWRTRFSIIKGIARGVLYLHEDSRLRIIHRDLKPSNVLLDHEMNPKISDFGMARAFCSNQNTGNTKRIMGTYGYMAPEYALEGLFSVKSDVYSYGVILLEIISGKKNIGFHLIGEDHSLVSYAWNLWSNSENGGLELLDPTLKNSNTINPYEVMKCIHIALLCVQDNPNDRPTMSSVVHMLSNESKIKIQQPSQPTSTVHRLDRRREGSTTEDKGISINDLTISTLCPR